jgi:hypothetical protein
MEGSKSNISNISFSEYSKKILLTTGDSRLSIFSLVEFVLKLEICSFHTDFQKFHNIINLQKWKVQGSGIHIKHYL